MIRAWSPAAVYEAEAALMATLPEGELMARAVAGLAEVARLRLHQRGGTRVVALVGPGNNGADALYAAAELAADGANVAAVPLPGTVHDGAYAAALAAGVVLTDAVEPIAEADLVLDGILGIGGRPGLPEWARTWVEQVPDPAYVIAVDLPSGADPEGRALDPGGVFADETVTFSVAKPVHLLPATEAACGLLTVVDIGLELTSEPAVRRLTHDDVADLWPVPGSRDDKYSRGVVGVVAGGERYSGAAVLTVTAAVESGAGMVRYAGSPTPTGLVRAAVPEAVIGIGRVQAWVIGPGLDVTELDPAQRAAALDALASDLPVVVDAGGLDLIEGRRSAPTLLTPHAGECARLVTRLARAEGGPAEGTLTRVEVEADPLRWARELVRLTGATVLLKGATTLVVDADSTVFSQADAPPWLATAGAGDVLAGLLGTLLASGLPPATAGALGALVHGVAAERANPGGPVRALRVAESLGPTIAHLLATGSGAAT